MKPRSKTTELSFILKASPIHGVGVFATHPVKRATKLRLFARGDRIRYLRLTAKYQTLVGAYGVPIGDGYYMCASDFGRMSIGWYLNHSQAPNAFHKNYTYFASRDIGMGEEITIDYDTL